MSASTGSPYLKPNDTTLTRSAVSDAPPKASRIRARSSCTFSARGVQDQVGLAADAAQQLALGSDPVHDPAVFLQRMRAADALEPADQGLVAGLEEHHAGPRARGRPARR